MSEDVPQQRQSEDVPNPSEPVQVEPPNQVDPAGEHNDGDENLEDTQPHPPVEDEGKGKKRSRK